MHLTKLKKISWLAILASSLIMVSCDDSDKDNNNSTNEGGGNEGGGNEGGGNEGGGNEGGGNEGGGNEGGGNEGGGNEETKVCNCELEDEDCINNCIRTVCSCNESVSLENCAAQCEPTATCGIATMDMGGGFNPFDPSSFSVEIKVTSKDQLDCMQKVIEKECDTSFKATCDGDRVKSCVEGHFSYKSCNGNGCNSETASCNTGGSGGDDTCNTSFQATCDGDRVKSCVDGHFSYQECNGKGCTNNKCNTDTSSSCDPSTCKGDYKCNESNECVFDTSKLPAAGSSCTDTDINKCLDNGKIVVRCKNNQWNIDTECGNDPCVAQKDDPNHMLLFGCGFDQYNSPYRKLDDAEKVSFSEGYIKSVEKLKDGEYYRVNCPVKVYTGEDNAQYYEQLSNTNCILCDSMDNREGTIQATACHSGNSDACSSEDTCVDNRNLLTCKDGKNVVRMCSVKCETKTSFGVTTYSCM